MVDGRDIEAIDRLLAQVEVDRSSPYWQDPIHSRSLAGAEVWLSSLRDWLSVARPRCRHYDGTEDCDPRCMVLFGERFYEVRGSYAEEVASSPSPHRTVRPLRWFSRRVKASARFIANGPAFTAVSNLRCRRASK